MTAARNLTIILPLLALFLYPLWQPQAARFLDPWSGSAGPGADHIRSGGAGSLTLEGVAINQFSKGSKDWQVEAQELIMDSDETDLRLEKVRVTFPDKDTARVGGQAAVKVCGEHARYMKNEKTLTLTGKVLLTTDSGYEISTSQARFLENTRQLKADAGVRIDGHNLSIRGQALTYAIDTRTLRLEGRVNAKIQ